MIRMHWTIETGWVAWWGPGGMVSILRIFHNRRAKSKPRIIKTFMTAL